MTHEEKPVTRHLRHTTVAALSAAALMVALAACTSRPDRGDDGPAPSATASASTDATSVDEAEATAQAHLGECVDDFVQLEATGEPITFGDCAAISILGSATEVTVGDAETISVEGDANHVTAGTVDSVLFAGTGNTVAHEGEAPEVTDLTDDPGSNSTNPR
jgi:hypothetical protein